jgi:menaquinone-dependent protoporphyrinogen IX oxidase
MPGKTLVAFHTKSGASGTYAKAIAEALKSKGMQVDLVDLREEKPDVSKYDNIVVGTGVRMSIVYWKWRGILKHKSIPGKKLFLFLSSGMAIKEPEKAVEKYVEPLVTKYKLKPLAVGSFPGFIPEKWAEPGAEKETVKPELAREWALKISEMIK